MKKIVSLLTLILILCSCSRADNQEINSSTDLNGRVMGCMSGSIFDQTINKRMPDSKVIYFNSRSELIMGLQTNKIDGYLADRPVAVVCCAENDNIQFLDSLVDEVEYGLCFSRNASPIREEFNEYLQEITKNGFINQLQDKWMKDDGINQTIGDIELTGTKGTIRACTTPDAAPFSFYKNNKFEGYEVELVFRFAKEYGYNLEISNTSFDALISAVSSNKYDIAFNGIYITDERKKSVDFSDPVYQDSVVPVVRKNINTSSNLFNLIKNKFISTFVEEERYKIILNGIVTTLIITSLSLLFGTIFGFITYLLSRKLGKWFTKFSDFMDYVISGLPVVVLLMVLFYIVFAKSPLSGKVVSIIGFSLIVCYSVYDMLKVSVGAIDKGQYEGALALGYSDSRALFEFVLPQALRIIMPAYRGEIVNLIKSSSIVGYITVEDLTRASDLIRSRTYDAFFPLIVTAIIYFILAKFITVVVDKIQVKFLPMEKTEEEILKSIKRK